MRRSTDGRQKAESGNGLDNRTSGPRDYGTGGRGKAEREDGLRRADGRAGQERRIFCCWVHLTETLHPLSNAGGIRHAIGCQSLCGCSRRGKLIFLYSTPLLKHVLLVSCQFGAFTASPPSLMTRRVFPKGQPLPTSNLAEPRLVFGQRLATLILEAAGRIARCRPTDWCKDWSRRQCS